MNKIHRENKINLLVIEMRARQQFSQVRPSGIKHPLRDNYLYTRVQMFLPFRYWEDVLCICDKEKINYFNQFYTLPYIRMACMILIRSKIKEIYDKFIMTNKFKHI